MSEQCDQRDPERTRSAPGRAAEAGAEAGADKPESTGDSARRHRLEALRQARIEGRLEIDPAVIADRLLDS
jgi:anti-sigma28 factor (negative regulator of flagellin synthesis)